MNDQYQGAFVDLSVMTNFTNIKLKLRAEFVFSTISKHKKKTKKMSIPKIQNEMRLLRRTTRVGCWIN
jgi:hypothetical protein